MRRLKTFRWWILLPLLFIFLVPAWVWLGDYLGYDIIIAPDPSQPRFKSELLGAFFYIIWYALALFVVLPATVLSIPLGIFITGQGRIEIGVILVSLFYSAILFYGFGGHMRRIGGNLNKSASMPDVQLEPAACRLFQPDKIPAREKVYLYDTKKPISVGDEVTRRSTFLPWNWPDFRLSNCQA